ncbi:sigma-70 family RNA polymerase sigma factor [Leucobacter coleopterorum]|uniref:Sigma-70 family RNA polymerase sigma factor n=1 Tax=Leucobacter coleopterorum TaxID=2714933 RepID=A0ABX6K016_9MICO|nr:sigma-70 family RNA polymerase sigma factor [Leucobacter coleopterorum]QIM19516.1 sigma-70 family RNA polymerase sigma factor [Leucobacter coleopterorum]
MGNREDEYTEGFLEDQELLRRHREGDAKAFGQLFNKHHQLAMRYARKYTVSADQAEDLVLEAFTRILATIQRGKGPTVSMGHYLVSTIRNVAITGVAFDTQEFARDPFEVAKLYENEHFADQVKTSEWLTDAFNTLSDRSQRVMWFRAVENLPSREIASMLGLSAATITREYQSAVGQLREQFVNFSVAEAQDPVCREYAPLLRRFAKRRGKNRALDFDESFRTHVATCERCTAVTSRLRASDRMLLSLVFVAGLGSLAVASLKNAPPAAASAFLSALSGPVKVAIVAAPVVVVGAVAAGVMIIGSMSSGSTAIELGQVPEGETSTLVRVGSCALTREVLDAKSEVWRLSTESEGCDVRISFSPTENEQRKAVTVLDTAATQDLRAVEVTQSGTYSVTVTNGPDAKQKSFEVRR